MTNANRPSHLEACREDNSSSLLRVQSRVVAVRVCERKLHVPAVDRVGSRCARRREENVAFVLRAIATAAWTSFLACELRERRRWDGILLALAAAAAEVPHQQTRFTTGEARAPVDLPDPPLPAANAASRAPDFWRTRHAVPAVSAVSPSAAPGRCAMPLNSPMGGPLRLAIAR